jgi:hypothetical protein
LNNLEGTVIIVGAIGGDELMMMSRKPTVQFLIVENTETSNVCLNNHTNNVKLLTLDFEMDLESMIKIVNDSNAIILTHQDESPLFVLSWMQAIRKSNCQKIQLIYNNLMDLPMKAIEVWSGKFYKMEEKVSILLYHYDPDTSFGEEFENFVIFESKTLFSSIGDYFRGVWNDLICQLKSNPNNQSFLLLNKLLMRRVWFTPSTNLMNQWRKAVEDEKVNDTFFEVARSIFVELTSDLQLFMSSTLQQIGGDAIVEKFDVDLMWDPNDGINVKSLLIGEEHHQDVSDQDFNNFEALPCFINSRSKISASKRNQIKERDIVLDWKRQNLETLSGQSDVSGSSIGGSSGAPIITPGSTDGIVGLLSLSYFL